MGLLSRHRYFAAAAGMTLMYAVVSLTVPKGMALAAFSDGFGTSIMLAAAAVTFNNAITRPALQRGFWATMALGFVLWSLNQVGWAYYEIVLRQDLPDPSIFDVVLFFHVVPMIAAVAWRPDWLKKDGRVYMTALNFLMLLGWWVLLYAFLVFPHEYVVWNAAFDALWYDVLYQMENGLLSVVLILAMLTSSAGWRKLYGNLLAAEVFYSVGSRLLDRAISHHAYYSGSLYDLPWVGAVLWMAATAVSARHWDLQTSDFRLHPGWKKVVPRLAMFAILSLPILGLWTIWLDPSPASIRNFRLLTVLSGMLLLGSFIFLRQFVQDHALIRLLHESRRAFDSTKSLQNQLVQKEKLASLGALVAGAAQEIDHPLTEIVNYSEQLWTQERLNDEQNGLVRKIVTQAQRSRDLVANLLRFARHAPGEKALVDLGPLLRRATQMVEWQHPGSKIQVRLSIDAELPRVWGNVNQLFQMFVEIIENAMDALQPSGGGMLLISAQRQGGEAVLEFSDTGPGIQEPLRVFDPFYTTKPVGKGTGLGLSVVYGGVEDHAGQITCHNKPEGGAVFLLKLPGATHEAARVAGASLS